MSTSIATMSSIGWITTPAEKADYVLSCFITCNQSQSVLFAGNITSLQYLIKKYANQSVELQIQLRNVLDKLMTAAFQGDSPLTEVQVVVPDDTKPQELSIQLNVTVAVDGVNYAVGKLVQAINAKVVAIKTLNAG